MDQYQRQRRSSRNQQPQQTAAPWQQGYIPQQQSYQGQNYPQQPYNQGYQGYQGQPQTPQAAAYQQPQPSPFAFAQNNAQQKKSAKPKRMKPLAIVGIVVLVLALIGGLMEAFGPKVPAYQVYDAAENYIRNGVQGVSYRVVIDPSVTDGELVAVYSDLKDRDVYSLHAVFFYSSSELIQNGVGYDVGRIMDETGKPVLDR